MPRIVVNAFLTLDGVMQAPGGPDEDRSGGFTHGGWVAGYPEEAVGRKIVEGTGDADGFLLGRRTYDIFAGYWPKVTDPGNPVATALNGLPKHVASRTLERVGWNASSLLRGDVVAAVRGLREVPGRTVQTWGSADLLQTLLANDLVDEYRLFVYPLVLGTGKRLFAGGTVPAALERLESFTTERGVTYLRLRRGGRPVYGTVGE